MIKCGLPGEVWDAGGGSLVNGEHATWPARQAGNGFMHDVHKMHNGGEGEYAVSAVAAMGCVAFKLPEKKVREYA
jgi:hypothetical protein